MKTKSYLIIPLAAWAIACAGCQQVATSDELFQRYEKTEIGQATSADVLSQIHDFETDYLSQSESVVASWGSDKKSHRVWFNIVAFDEDQLLAVRKYAMIANEKSTGVLVAPEQKLRFECKLVLPQQALDEPYTSENARRIALLKVALTLFADDINQLTDDSQVLRSASMLTKQVINAALTRLRTSPAYARDLTDTEGMEFHHWTMGKSRINLYLENDTIEIRIKVGKSWFHKPVKLF